MHPAATNIFRLRTPGANDPAYQTRLEAAGISARIPTKETHVFQVNETWNRIGAAEIIERFRRVLG